MKREELGFVGIWRCDFSVVSYFFFSTPFRPKLKTDYIHNQSPKSIQRSGDSYPFTNCVVCESYVIIIITLTSSLTNSRPSDTKDWSDDPQFRESRKIQDTGTRPVKSRDPKLR